MKKKEVKFLSKNVVMFPGMYERLLTEAHNAAEEQNYSIAVEKFSEAFKCGDGDEHSLAVFSYSLYELRMFEEAREVAETLLALGPDRYFEAMELYLSICMELRDFHHVNKLVSSLLEENIVPEPSVEKFQSILNLSEKLTGLSEEVVTVETPSNEMFELEMFKSLPIYTQMQHVSMLEQMNIRPIVEEIIAIIEDMDLHPIIRSVALYMLVVQQVECVVQVEKFGYTESINTSDLTFPEEMPVTKEVLLLIEELLLKESSMYEVAKPMIARHILASYPFEWFGHESKEVAQGYVDFIHKIFGQSNPEMNEMISLIEDLEVNSHLPEV